MIAIYVDSDMERFFSYIHLSIDFVFKTLGYEYKIIQSIEDLGPKDVLLFYSDFQITPQEAEYIAYDQILLKINMEKLLWAYDFYGFDELKELFKKIKIITQTPILTKYDIKELVTIQDSKHCRIVNINFDLFANVFFHLSGYYDYLAKYSKEEKLKAPEHNSFEEFAYQPFVNHILYIMDATLQTIFLESGKFACIRKDIWPRGEDFAIAISHSVDKLYKWPGEKLLKSFFEDLLVFYRVKYVFKNFISKMNMLFTNKEEYWNFDKISEMEHNYFIKSTYFWGSDISDEENFDYDLDDADIIEVIKELEAAGHNNSLLVSRKTVVNDIYKSQISRMEKVTGKTVLGLRIQDYLFDLQKTPKLFKRNNIFYDATFGFEKRNGFKNGIAYPYDLLDLDFTDSSVDIKITKTGTIEIPLVFKDENLKINRYKNISFERASKQVEELIKSIKVTNGLLTFDFTVSNFSDIDYNFKLYETLLRKILKLKPYIATYSELSTWWKKRGAVHITEGEGYFIIYFPEELKQFSFHLYTNDVSNVEIEGTDFKRDPKDENKFILKNIKSNSKVYVTY